jgi:hypothetical protein
MRAGRSLTDSLASTAEESKELAKSGGDAAAPLNGLPTDVAISVTRNCRQPIDRVGDGTRRNHISFLHEGASTRVQPSGSTRDASVPPSLKSEATTSAASRWRLGIAWE